MVKCSKCNVYINSSTKICPLCKNELKVEKLENYEDLFPYVPIDDKKNGLWYKIIILIFFLNSAICMLVNYLITHTFTWSPFVVFANICVGSTIYFGDRKKRSLSGLLLTEYLLIGIISIVWDYITNWHMWSINYVVPLLSTTFMLLSFILRFVFKKRYKKYDGNLACAGLIGIICTILLNKGIITVAWPAYVSGISAIFFLLYLAVFDGKKLLPEIKKRLHI